MTPLQSQTQIRRIRLVGPESDPPSAVSARMRMAFPDRFEREMIEFVIRWFRYGGGPPAEIFELFGLDEKAFFWRVLSMTEVDAQRYRCLDPLLRKEIRVTCKLRLDAIAATATPALPRNTSKTRRIKARTVNG